MRNGAAQIRPASVFRRAARSDISFIAVSVALYGFCTVPRGGVFHLRGHASETILHRATIIDARSSGTRERSACAEVSAEVNINYYTGDCIPDEGLSKNPGDEKPATCGNLAENRGETSPEKNYCEDTRVTIRSPLDYKITTPRAPSRTR